MALSVTPSGIFSGNDGSWSTFYAFLGNPGQKVELLPGTSASAHYAVLPLGCSIPPDPSDCEILRGGLFNPNSSSDFNWASIQISPNEPYFEIPFQSEAYLPGYSGINSEIGYDTALINLFGDPSSKTLETQVIAGYAAPIPWLGLLGINGRPIHTLGYSSSVDSPLTAMLNATNASRTWGYTAGAPYLLPPVFASLTLGGYDAARVNFSSSLTVPFGADTPRDLTATIKDIALTINNGTAKLSIGGIPFFSMIDSVVPEIWLPEVVCDKLALILGLVWNETTGLYLINDTQHTNLLVLNPVMTITLAASATSTEAVQVSLPYAAFDSTLEYPLAGITDNTTLRYFPVKRGSNTTQYFLGRTFLQEAYVTADYDRQHFTIGQALIPYNTSVTDIVTITKSTLADRKIEPSQTSLTSGAIAGVAVGAVTAVILTVVSAWLWWRRRQKRNATSRQGVDSPFLGMKAELDGIVREKEPPGELGPDGEVMELGGLHKPHEADHTHAIAELPGDWEGNEIAASARNEQRDL